LKARTASPYSGRWSDSCSTTGIGRGLAIPHVRYDELSDLILAVGRSDNGIDFASVDGAPVSLVFLILSPESHQEDYLAALRWVSIVARDEYHNKLLHGARTQDDFIELFQDIEEAL
jgi:mannitol/fructose-specific phosphotransferase system IIA component (Ntr-type)